MTGSKRISLQPCSFPGDTTPQTGINALTHHLSTQDAARTASQRQAGPGGEAARVKVKEGVLWAPMRGKSELTKAVAVFG